MTESPRSTEVLKTVGRYDVLDVVGRGGAAVVYLARQRDLDREVALKELSPAQVGDPTFARRFLQESRLIGSLSHPNIVTVYEYFEEAGAPYIAMEYVMQGSLRSYIGDLSLPQIAGILEGVLAGLAHGQGRGVVHRDLKPENLLITDEGRVKIADFGIARAYDNAVTRSRITATGTTVGTPSYMAPEQALGRPLGPATDLYSLGMITWELLTGETPFNDTDTPVAVMFRHVHGEIPPVRTVNPAVHAGVADWLDRMIAKEPADRFQDAATAWEAIEEVILDLEGPRWRRHARLDAPAHPDPVQPLTPAPFATAPESITPADPLQAQSPPVAADAHAERPEERPATNETIAPRRPVAPIQPTVHRIVRRHAADEQAPLETAPQRRSVRVVAIAVGVIAAAVLGAVAGTTGGGHTGPPTRSASTNLAPPLAASSVKALDRVLTGVASSRSRELAAMARARTPAVQAAAAQAIADAYRSGAQQIAAMAAPVRSLPIALSLEQTLLATSRQYSGLARAASDEKRGAYKKAAATIVVDESQLRGEAASLAPQAHGG